MKVVEIAPAFESWQVEARALLREDVHPQAVTWLERADALPAGAGPSDPAIRVPRQFVDLARRVAQSADPERWRVLYTVLWRLVHERRDLLDDRSDWDVSQLLRMDHGAPAGAASRASVPAPAASTTPGTGAGPFLPPARTIGALREAAARCTGCELHRGTTQTVFSMGPADARVALVGEQPGDQEDLKGAPFVGPAGEVLDRALKDVGLAREALYVSNAVKHFKFVPRGKRRIHQTPTVADVTACRPWIEAELEILRPEVLVCMGATASRALLGPDFRLMRDRGRFFESRWAPRTIATLHPSAVLRGEDDAMQARLYAMLRDDLRQVAGVL